jgi:transcriptional regulator with XRE-family HTH domain
MSSGRIDFGDYLLKLRKNKGYSQKKVAEKLGVDISLLSKIEHGERQFQSHMLKPFAELFKLDYDEIQINFLSQKISDEYGKQPFFIKALLKITKDKTQNNSSDEVK